jgi:hypothetical protein
MERLFDRLVLHPLGSDWHRQDDAKPVCGSGRTETVMHIELVVRAAIVGYQGISPILRREPLPASRRELRQSLPLQLLEDRPDWLEAELPRPPRSAAKKAAPTPMLAPTSRTTSPGLTSTPSCRSPRLDDLPEPLPELRRVGVF